MYTDQEGKMNAIWNFFHQLLGRTRPRQHSLNFRSIGIEPIDLSDQEAPITAEEVHAAIFELPSHKAPGTDSFTTVLLKKMLANFEV